MSAFDPTQIEIAVVIIFIATAYHAFRSGRGRLRELVSAAIYGLLLEEGDILIFGTYFYSDDFRLVIDQVPIAIGLAWAVIIYTCMRLSDFYGLPRHIAPFADALWAIMLDLVFDAVAIRMGLWHWNIPLDAGYFGVPAGNFYAWLFVALSFSALTRQVRLRNEQGKGRWWQLGVPLAAYLGLLVALAPYIVFKRLFFSYPGGGMPIFWATLATFAVITAYPLARRWLKTQKASDPFTTVVRTTFHAYFLAAIVAQSMYLQAPALMAVSAAMLVMEALLGVPPGSLRRLATFASARLNLPRRLTCSYEAGLRIEDNQ